MRDPYVWGVVLKWSASVLNSQSLQVVFKWLWIKASAKYLTFTFTLFVYMIVMTGAAHISLHNNKYRCHTRSRKEG